MQTIIHQLQTALGKKSVLTQAELQERYHHIWQMHQPLQAKAVVLPRSTKEVSTILKICHAVGQPVVIHGGLTNLVGGTETTLEEVVISMEKLNTIEEVDPQSRTVTVQAGVTLEQIQQTVQNHDLLFPLNFGAKGSAQIGGIIATNAGGLRVFRYGMTRNLVLGLEAVLADGTIISSMKKIIKDNSGYDLKQLFIGSEGTLGVVTRAILKLQEAPKSRMSAFVGINEYDKVVDFLKYVDKSLAGMLSGFELIWNNTYRTMTSPPALMKPPIPYNYNYYVLLEALGSHPEKDQYAFERLLVDAFNQEKILDAGIATTESDLKWFWAIREDVRVLSTQCNHDQHFDISLPIPLIGETIQQMRATLVQIPEVEIVHTFGHMADGNIHFVIGKSEQSPELIHQINEVIYYPLRAIGGSVSAEHGIGVHKKKYLPISRTPAEIALMRTLKAALDSKGILNRGKIFDSP